MSQSCGFLFVWFLGHVVKPISDIEAPPQYYYPRALKGDVKRDCFNRGPAFFFLLALRKPLPAREGFVRVLLVWFGAGKPPSWALATPKASEWPGQGEEEPNPFPSRPR